MGMLVVLAGMFGGQVLAAGYDGQGSVMMTPNTPVAASSTGTWTIVYTVDSQGMSAGGGVRVDIPWNWTAPQNSNGNNPGFIFCDNTTNTVGATPMVIATGQSIYVTFSSAVVGNAKITLVYGSFSVNAGGRVAAPSSPSSWNSFNVSSDLDGTPGSDRGKSYNNVWNRTTNMNISVTGPMTGVRFGAYQQTVLKNSVFAVVISTSDDGGSPAGNAPSNVKISLTASTLDPTTNIPSGSRTSITLFTNASGTLAYGELNAVTANTVAPITLMAGSSALTLYVSDSAAGKARLNAVATLSGQTRHAGTEVIVLNSGVGGVTIDTGVMGALTTVTLTPDGDGKDETAYVNFTLEKEGDWQVVFDANRDGTFSTSNDFNPNVTQDFNRGGRGMNNRVQIEGRGSQPGFFGPYPNGNYPIRIMVGSWSYDSATGKNSFNAAATNTSLTIVVQTGAITGRTFDNAGNTLANAQVGAYGMSGGSQATSGSDGTFTLGGMRTGSYGMNARKSGFAEANVQNVSVTSGQTTTQNLTLARGATLRVVAVRPTGSYSFDVFGGINAFSTGGQGGFGGYANLHFATGTGTLSDNGFNNPSDTLNYKNYSELGLAAGTYEVRVERLSGLGGDTWSLVGTTLAGTGEKATVTLTAGQTATLQFNLAKRAGIKGVITLASKMEGGQFGGVHMGVEAFRANDPNDYSQRYWGGAWFNGGTGSQNFEIAGVKAGVYKVKVRPEGFSEYTHPVNITVTASSASPESITISSSDFSRGSSITGVFALSSGTLSEQQQYVWLNVFSRNGYGRGAQVKLTGSAVNYIVGGLAAGEYEMNSFVSGYEMDLFANGKRSVTVGSSSTPVTQNITLRAFTGFIAGEVTFGADASPNYQNVRVFVNPMFGGPGSGGPSQPGGGFANKQATLTFTSGKYTYQISGLGTGAFNVMTMYQFDPTRPTTQYPFKNTAVRVVNGQTSTVNFDLGGTARKIFGTVTTASNNTKWNSIANITTNASRETRPDAQQGKSIFRVVALPVNEFGAGGGMGSDFGAGNSGGLGFFGEVTPSTLGEKVGTFTIPNLPDGAYKLFVPGTLSLSSQGGSGGGPGGSQAPDVISTSAVVFVKGADVTNANVTISDGYSIEGDVSLPAGSSDTTIGEVNVYQRGPGGYYSPVRITFQSGTPQHFKISKKAPGKYVVEVRTDKFATGAKAVEITSADVNDANIELKKGANIKCKLKDFDSGTLITGDNETQYLGGLRIYVQANPWVEGGYKEARDWSTNKTVGSDQYVTIKNVPSGTYDFIISNNSYGYDQSTTKNYAPIQIAGVVISDDDVTNNAAKDLGTIDLTRGEQVSGKVTDKATGLPLANVLVVGKPSNKGNWATTATTRTDKKGEFTLLGLNKSVKYFSFIAAPRQNYGSDGGFDRLISGDKYGQVRKDDVNITVTKTGIDFALRRATGAVSGAVYVTDGGTLQPMFGRGDNDVNFGADVVMQDVTDVTGGDPLGDIQVSTKPDGAFFLDGLVTGTYKLRVMARGYSAVLKEIAVAASGTTPVPSITLARGGKVTGTILKPDGSKPNTNEASGVVAVTSDFGEILYAQTDSDSTTKLVSGYTIEGLAAGKTYVILILPRTEGQDGPPDNMIDAGTVSLSLATDLVTKNLVYQQAGPKFIARFAKSGSSIQLNFFSTQALRNSTSDDQDPTKVMGVKTGTTSGLTNITISADRRTITCLYTPSTTETSFTLTLHGFSNVKDATTNSNFEFSQEFKFFTGFDGQAVEDINNMMGAQIKIEGDATSASFGSGTFDTGGTLSATVGVTLYKVSTTSSGAPKHAPEAYPMHMRKMNSLAPAVPDSKSGFYDLYLSKSLALGKTYNLKVAYSGSSNTDKLNVFYLNETTNKWEKETTNRSVDTEAGTITVALKHASRFVVAEADAIAGDAYDGATFEAFNFPNPFDLMSKTVTLSKSGTGTTTTTGTMLRYALPTAMTGDVTFELYNLAGEKVRILTDAAKTGGYYYYKEWDGKNDDGSQVASGVYVCVAKAKGATKTFKLAVVK